MILCGGTLITRKAALSAVHCFSDFDEIDFKTTFVYANISQVYSYASKRAQKSRIRHIYANFQTKPILGNLKRWRPDVAVILLETAFKLDAFVRPACLPQKEAQMGLNCYTSGWGLSQKLTDKELEEIHRTDKAPNLNLKAVKLKLIPSSFCQSDDTQTLFLNRYEICAGAVQKGPCLGDSGGPLICLGN